ncbi:hypothetical protein ACN47E_007726 [Coniothyrium glycines]
MVIEDGVRHGSINLQHEVSYERGGLACYISTTVLARYRIVLQTSTSRDPRRSPLMSNAHGSSKVHEEVRS